MTPPAIVDDEERARPVIRRRSAPAAALEDAEHEE